MGVLTWLRGGRDASADAQTARTRADAVNRAAETIAAKTATNAVSVDRVLGRVERLDAREEARIRALDASLPQVRRK